MPTSPFATGIQKLRAVLFSRNSVRTWNLALSWIVFFGLFIALLKIEPHFSAFRYQKDTQTSMQPTSLPLDIATTTKELRVHINVSLQPVHPTRLRFISGDCFTAMWVNDVRVENLPENFCPQQKTSLNLAGYLRPGINDIAFIIANKGKFITLNINPDRTDPLLASFNFALLALLILSVTLTYRRFGSRELLPQFLIFGAGALLRQFYVFVTTYDVRSYDWIGHLDYVKYIHLHGQIPAPDAGWQFYHPPLYYILASCWSWFGWMTGDIIRIVDDLQGLSLLLSFVTLAVALWVSRLVFPRDSQRLERIVLGCTFAFFPTLVFYSSRVSNDALLVPLLFVAFAFTIRWWRHGNIRDWILACVGIGLGLLTKSNALPLLAVLWFCLLLRPYMSWRQRGELLAISLVTVGALFAWLPLVRGTPGGTSLVGNYLTPSLKVPTNLQTLTTFNPIEILKHPINNTWSDPRREYLWEFLFRSAFTGEFEMGTSLRWAVKTLLVFGFLAMPLALFGLIRELLRNRRETLPIALTFGIFFLAIFVFRILSPYSASQDFRYIPLALVPLSAYAIRGALCLRSRARYVLAIIPVGILVLSLIVLTTLVLRW